MRTVALALIAVTTFATATQAQYVEGYAPGAYREVYLPPVSYVYRYATPGEAGYYPVPRYVTPVHAHRPVYVSRRSAGRTYATQSWYYGSQTLYVPLLGW